MKIPLLDLRSEYLSMKEEIDSAIARCFEHQHWILGPEVKELEDRLAVYLGVKHCVGASSGTDALVLALRALALQTAGQEYFSRADLIITTPFTFTATGDAIIRAGATPLFVDIDPLTYNIDAKNVREALSQSYSIGVSQNARVVGIIPVHLYGQACDMDEIMRLAEEFGLFVVEDVAQAFGGTWRDKKLGSIGNAGAFSFFPSKNLGGIGDGGMIASNNDELSGLIRVLLKHGGKDKYDVEHVGYNARLDTLQATVLLAKLSHIDDRNTRRRTIAGMYQERLAGVKEMHLPGNDDANFGSHVYHQYTARISEGRRDALKHYLSGEGIETAVYYPVPLHKMALFRNLHALSFGSLNEAEAASRTVLSLPVDPFLGEEQLVAVCYAINRFLSL